MMKEYRDVLILACSRSGTAYTAEYLNRLGADVGHERIKRNGAIGWMYVTGKQYHPENGFTGDYEWGTTLHQVRHPLCAIASMQSHDDVMIKWIARELGGLPENRLHATMLYWLLWNEKIEEKTGVFYRVEDVWPHGPADHLLKGAIKHRQSRPFTCPTKKMNTRPHEDLSWRDLETCDLRAARYIYRLAHKYGYTD